MIAVALKMLARVVDAKVASLSWAQAFKTATLLKTLNVNALIVGEIGVGKKSLASYILPKAAVFDSSNYNELMLALKSVDSVIITNLENSQNIKITMDFITKQNIRVVATASNLYKNEAVDRVFSAKLDIPSLRERPEDVDILIDKYMNEAISLFGTSEMLKTSDIRPNLSQNSHSLRKQIMIQYLLQNIGENELMDIVENYLFDKLGSSSDYENFLHIYEVPLIKAGLQRFKSQLQLSSKLGLNRNTLRKKIFENSKYF